MRKIRELLRLRFGEGLSIRAASVSVNLPETTARECLLRASQAGLSWPLSEELDDEVLEARLYLNRVSTRPAGVRPQPDCGWIFEEMKKRSVTLALLWSEYIANNPAGYKYSRFCDTYREWLAKLSPTMRQSHVAGEKAFVDFAGQTIPIYCPHSHEIVFRAEVFVAVLGASSYTFARAVESQKTGDWIQCNTKALEAFGGVPAVTVPDNLRAGVKDPSFYDPVINVTFSEWARHYGTVVIPARARKPRDKAKVEVGVQVVERWVIAALRHRRFYSLHELNLAIEELVQRLNNRPMRHLGESRSELWKRLDRPALKPLPSAPFEMAIWGRAKVNIDYHVAVDKRLYSVPHTLIRREVETRATASLVEIFCKGVRVASHPKVTKIGGYSTIADHMPQNHRAVREWSPERVQTWASRIGPQVGELAEEILTRPEHPEQGIRACLGLIRLKDTHSAERLNAACRRSLAMRVATYRDVKRILKLGLEFAAVDPAIANPPPLFALAHDNIRGAAYFK